MKKLRKTFFPLLLILPMLFLSANVNAQSDPTAESPATRTYAIQNATIVQAPGNVIEGGTIVIENGLISAVGKNVNIPAYAEIIDGTDLFVYPGFIDGMAYTGAKRPEQPERPRNLFTPDPPNEYAGITPEKHVVDQIVIDDASISSMRKLGFTVSHTVPYGRMLPGSGALLLLTEKEHADLMLLQEDVSLYTQFAGAPGAYPGNTLGIMAKFRNLYRNAELSKQHSEMYASGPAGMERPTRDRTLEAFYPVVAKQKPIFYNANTALEARRAIRLKNELGFNLVIGNLQQGWDLVDAIKNSGTQVFMSLELPEEPKEAKEEDQTEEVKQLEERRMEFYKRYLTQYAEMKKAGVKFGFSTIDASAGKIKKNLKTLLDYGMTEDDLLAALTIDAAELLGINTITGSLEKGKLGNAVITKGAYFADDSQVKYVFVDGDKFDFEVKEKKANGENAAPANAEAIVGTWSYTVMSPEGEQGGKMIIRMEDGFLAGTLTSNDGSPDNDMQNISFRDGELNFEFSIDAGGQSVLVLVSGPVTGNEFDGEATVEQFNVSFPLRATKDEAK
ncbi:amidohydrolase family protein [Balneola vulgaris]|uniref:amidohydrolase family protein n=1 Tax=Balneola vulgaris TaxID=287535 RepID=UPI0003620957|nr:amidohydrolase family protein [Balneola vulgaris]